MTLPQFHVVTPPIKMAAPKQLVTEDMSSVLYDEEVERAINEVTILYYIITQYVYRILIDIS